MIRFFTFFLFCFFILTDTGSAGTVTPLCSVLQDPKTYEKEKALKSYRYLIAGMDGWVFRSSSDVKEDFKIDRYGLKKMADLQMILRQSGTELVLAIVPSRGLVAHEHLDRSHPLTKDYDVTKALESYHSLINDLNDAGVPTAGVTKFDTIGDGFFYKQDHHWNAQGARATAETVADLVKDLPVYKKIKKQAFETRTEKDLDYIGSYAERIEDFCKIAQTREKIPVFQTSVKGRGISAFDLFGGQKFPDIVLVGTSNSVETAAHANFDGALKQALGADVYNAAISGGGFDTSLLAYLGSKEFKEHPPKVLIWEFPAYYTITKSSQSGKQMNEFIAAAFGVCSHENKITDSVNKLMFQETTLLSNLNAFPDTTKPIYVALNFETHVYKRFKLDTFFSDSDNRHYTFEPSRSSPDSTNFYLLLEPGDTALNRIETRVHKDMIGLSVKATLCRPPVTLQPFVKELDPDGKDSDSSEIDDKEDDDK